MTTENIPNTSDLIVATAIMLLGIFVAVCVVLGLAWIMFLFPPKKEAKTKSPVLDQDFCKSLYGPIPKMEEGVICVERMNNLLWNYKFSDNKFSDNEFFIDTNIRAVIGTLSGGTYPRTGDGYPFFSDTANLIESFLRDSTKNQKFEISDTERYFFERIRDYYLSCAEYEIKMRKYDSLTNELDTAVYFANNGDYSAHLSAKSLREERNKLRNSFGECPFIKRIHGYFPHI